MPGCGPFEVDELEELVATNGGEFLGPRLLSSDSRGETT
jgi:hypothetical protein